jgi:hypothetical protein
MKRTEDQRKKIIRTAVCDTECITKDEILCGRVSAAQNKRYLILITSSGGGGGGSVIVVDRA